MHVCSRIIKVISTKSIVIISSKDRDTLASITSSSGMLDMVTCGLGPLQSLQNAGDAYGDGGVYTM